MVVPAGKRKIGIWASFPNRDSWPAGGSLRQGDIPNLISWLGFGARILFKVARIALGAYSADVLLRQGIS